MIALFLIVASIFGGSQPAAFADHVATTGSRCPEPYVSPEQIGFSFSTDTQANDIYQIYVVVEHAQPDVLIGWIYQTGDKTRWFEPALLYNSAPNGPKVELLEKGISSGPGTVAKIGEVTPKSIYEAIKGIAQARNLEIQDADFPQAYQYKTLVSEPLAEVPCFSELWHPKAGETGLPNI